ncbi:glycosyltransferase family 4 protein [Algoriphagus limi]|uniref:Glycosyltransferase family 4 protein n=1 Tax=Algoriphagus limi TaxID=2975273 RepID=A0ABT2G1N5_9BACT|nr:glycosyltransferase family 4 protein [Algoriphagus limi]MCS5489185.1 glycosyltransferase family 4 protein [Algoriphagus limi]
MESVVEVLASGFANAGHEVVLVTRTALTEGKVEKEWGFNLHRNPPIFQYWRWANKADVILHNCVSLKHLIPDLFYNHKFFVIHHTWFSKTKRGQLTFTASLKRWVSRWVHNCYISPAIEQSLGIKGKVIPNPYDSKTFKIHPSIQRTKNLVFLGRLVSDKGCDILLQALYLYVQAYPNSTPRLTVIGDGPEREGLEAYAQQHLPEQVTFVGKLQGEALTACLNEHQIMVVPSIWDEPFGVVALEGLACGCLIIGSERGGLKDAIGPCGWTFPNGNALALAKLLQEVWTNRAEWEEKYAAIPAHLYRHQPAQVVNAYLDYFSQYV